jgi:hypothetical protein
MRLAAVSTLLTLGLCSLATGIVLAAPAQRGAGASASQELRPQDIARRSFPSVVLIVCDSGGEGASQGSGFFVAPGLVVTNFHVIENCVRGVARAIDGRKEPLAVTEVVAYDKNADLAILRVPEGASVAPLPLASRSVETGEPVYALGNPEGLSGSLSDGLVSNARRSDGTRDLIQISAPISHGSSGGPVVNNRGQVIGVAVGSIEKGQNLNFAIPVSYVRILLTAAGRDVDRVAASGVDGAWSVPLGLAPVPTARAQAPSIIGAERSGESGEEASLRGLPGLRVLVEHFDEDAQRYLSHTAVVTAVELALRRSGIKVLSEEQWLATPGNPYLYVNVSVLDRGDGLIVYTVDCVVKQTITLDRDPACPILFFGTTWKSPSPFGTVGSSRAPDSLMRNVLEQVDVFINAFLKAQ